MNITRNPNKPLSVLIEQTLTQEQFDALKAGIECKDYIEFGQSSPMCANSGITKTIARELERMDLFADHEDSMKETYIVTAKGIAIYNALK